MNAMTRWFAMPNNPCMAWYTTMTNWLFLLRFKKYKRVTLVPMWTIKYIYDNAHPRFAEKHKSLHKNKQLDLHKNWLGSPDERTIFLSNVCPGPQQLNDCCVWCNMPATVLRHVISNNEFRFLQNKNIQFGRLMTLCVGSPVASSGNPSNMTEKRAIFSCDWSHVAKEAKLDENICSATNLYGLLYVRLSARVCVCVCVYIFMYVRIYLYVLLSIFVILFMRVCLCVCVYCSKALPQIATDWFRLSVNRGGNQSRRYIILFTRPFLPSHVDSPLQCIRAVQIRFYLKYQFRCTTAHLTKPEEACIAQFLKYCKYLKPLPPPTHRIRPITWSPPRGYRIIASWSA